MRTIYVFVAVLLVLVMPLSYFAGFVAQSFAWGAAHWGFLDALLLGMAVDAVMLSLLGTALFMLVDRIDQRRERVTSPFVDSE